MSENMMKTEHSNNLKTMFTKEQLSMLGLDKPYFQKEEVTDDEQ